MNRSLRCLSYGCIKEKGLSRIFFSIIMRRLKTVVIEGTNEQYVIFIKVNFAFD